jgi:hypothetical protein
VKRSPLGPRSRQSCSKPVSTAKVRSNLLAGNLYWLPKSRQVFNHSRAVAVFDYNGERIEIRHVIKPPARRH